MLGLSAAPSACLAGLIQAQLPPKPLTNADFHDFDPQLAEIGRLLFYDPVLSGNRNISCGTCHHHELASGDGLALGVGEGGEGHWPQADDRTGAMTGSRSGCRAMLRRCSILAPATSACCFMTGG
jgi:cytochrome c peroxidase